MRRQVERLATYMTGADGDERGLNTAELLGNAALAIVALVAIWAGLQSLGIDLIDQIGQMLTGEVSGAVGP